MLRGFGISDKGRSRPTNEDCFAVDEALGLCVVADGMGGHNAGEVAAKMAVDAIVGHVRDSRGDWPFGFDRTLSTEGNVLRTAVHIANLQIREAAVDAAQYAGMGTTIVAARAVAGRLVFAHAGDSRLYVFAHGRLRQLTDDDSWVATVLAREPDADRVALAQHPMRNALTNVIGSRGRTDVHVDEHRLDGGELLLLTTDGVHGVVDDARLEEILRKDGSPRGIATQVVATALACGTRDNVTAVVARYTER
ncbi:MAG TPA: protein phosphatase 2C domain-containing protein [Vicinamibacterales bacterium]|nr:protein phosphatase 2C domain-containing protein [Vicinamibacterales bacterium]